MPPGFGGGKAPLELPDDPIETDPSEAKHPPPQRRTKAGKLLPKSNLEIKHFATFAPDNAPEIQIPYTVGHTKSPRKHIDSLSGPHQPVDRLHRSQNHALPNTGRKRQRQQNYGDNDNSEAISRKKPSTQHPDIDCEDGDNAAGRQPMLGGGYKRIRQSKGKATDEYDVDSEESSPHFPPRFPNSVRSRQDHDDIVEETPQVVGKLKRKPRGLLSTKNKQDWPLLSFQRGALQRDNDEEELSLSLNVNQFRVSAGGTVDEQLGFSIDKIREISYCQGERAFCIKLLPGLGYTGLAAANVLIYLEKDFDIQSVRKCFAGHPINDITEERLKEFCNNIKTLIDRQQAEVPLVQDQGQDGVKPRTITEEIRLKDRELTKNLQEQQNRKSSKSRLGQVKSSTPNSLKGNTRSKKQDKFTEVSKRPRSVESDHRETRSAKIRKLELPQPEWSRPLLYPFEGPKRANVDYQDLSRLDDEEFLNDNLINFYLRYIEENLKVTNNRLFQETHFFNTFFYERLTMKGDKQRNMEGVLKWTAKIDLFKKNYVIVPINESSHWYLAIICNLQHLERKLAKDDLPPIDSDTTTQNDLELSDNSSLSAGRYSVTHPDFEKDLDIAETRNSLESMSVDEDDHGSNDWPAEDIVEHPDSKLEDRNRKSRLRKEEANNSELSVKTGAKSLKSKARRKSSHAQSPDTPAIIILDSMSSKRPVAVGKLKDWLVLEARTKRGLQVKRDDIKGNHATPPGQNNWYDCGLYVLHYIEVFLNHAEEFVKSFLTRDNSLEKSLWREDEIRGMRLRLFDLIVKLHTEYEGCLAKIPGTTVEAKTKAKDVPLVEVSMGIDEISSEEEPSGMRAASPGSQITKEAYTAASIEHVTREGSSLDTKEIDHSAEEEQSVDSTDEGDTVVVRTPELATF